MSEARDRMVASAVVLLARHGVQATSFSAVLDASGAPRGSIYHHFPDGKDQLIAAAIDLAGQRAIALLDLLAGLPPEGIVEGFLLMWRSVLDQSGFTAGCSVLAVTVSSESADLLDRADAILRAWQRRLGDLLVDAGIGTEHAASLAALVVAASEGAVVLSRAARSFEPFDQVADRLRGVARTEPCHT